MRKWTVHCPGCKADWVFEWGHVDIDRECLACPQKDCETIVTDVNRAEVLNSGRWVATNPEADPEIVSFHMNQLQSPLTTLKTVFRAYRQAERNGELREFFADRMGLEDEIELDTFDVQDDDRLRVFDERPFDVPDIYACLTDVQGNRLEAMWITWKAKTDEFYVERMLRIDRTQDDDAAWDEWRAQVDAEAYQDIVFVDAAFEPNTVVAQLQRVAAGELMMHRSDKTCRFRAIRGMSPSFDMLIPRGFVQGGSIFLLSVDEAKMTFRGSVGLGQDTVVEARAKRFREPDVFRETHPRPFPKHARARCG